MITIYKYPLVDVLAINGINAPIVKPLRVEYQNGELFFWALVNTKLKPRDVMIYKVGTGWDIEDLFGKGFPIDTYLNTTVQGCEPNVWHWFCEMGQTKVTFKNGSCIEAIESNECARGARGVERPLRLVS